MQPVLAAATAAARRVLPMRQMSCADLIPGCEAVFQGETDNIIALQYVIHLHLMHRSWPVAVSQLLDVITDAQPDGSPSWSYGTAVQSGRVEPIESAERRTGSVSSSFDDVEVPDRYSCEWDPHASLRGQPPMTLRAPGRRPDPDDGR